MVWINLKGRSLEFEEKVQMFDLEMECRFFRARKVVLFHSIEKNRKWV